MKYQDKYNIDDPALGAGNILYWLRDRIEDLDRPLIWLDGPWQSPNGSVLDHVSLSEMLEGVESLRAMYRDISIHRRKPLVIQFSHPFEVYLHWAALAAEGAIAAPVNPNLPDEIVRDYAQRIGASGIMSRMVVGVQNDVGQGVLSWRPSAKYSKDDVNAVSPPTQVDSAREHYAYEQDDIVLLCHTSGTTGKPKSVSVRHHGFMTGICSELSQPASPLLRKRMLNALPAGHLSSLSTIVWALLGQIELVIVRDQSAQVLVDAVERYEPSAVTSFSCTLRDVARLGLEEGALRSVGIWMSTGDACRRSDIANVTKLGTHPQRIEDVIVTGYGMFVLDCFGSSELGHMHFSSLHAPGRLQKARCIGRPVSFVTAAILDGKGNELPAGEVGLIGVRSASVTPSYWNDTERTINSQFGNYWITGDVGFRDEYGRYFHLDRSSDVIETPNGPVYSVQCEEELLHAFPEIERCAIVARDDEMGGLKTVCLIETRDSVYNDQAWLQKVNETSKAASMVTIDEVVMHPVGGLPVGPTGKIRKFKSREALRV